MKKLVKIVSLVLSLLILLTSTPLTVFADSTAQNSLRIYSENPPQSATEFAKDQFSHLHSETLMGMGFTADEVSNFRLAPGFEMQPLNSSKNLANILYWYPVICYNKIVAILQVSYYKNRYVFQLEVGGSAESLNEIANRGSNTPLNIVCSENACYAIVNNKAVLLKRFINADKDDVVTEQASLQNVCLPMRSIQEVVTISNDSAYSERILPVSMAKSLDTFLIHVPLVYNDGIICWAACLGSLIDYYLNGSLGNNNSSGTAFRNLIVDEHMTMYPLNGGNHDTEIPYFMYKYANRHISRYNYDSWQTAFNEIIYGRPFLTGWVRDDGGPGHMMVLCGVECDPSNVYNENYQKIILMDPDVPTYTYLKFHDPLVTTAHSFMMLASYR